MFVIKYHSKGKKVKYFSRDRGLVSTLKCATAFGEDLRQQFYETLCGDTVSLKTIDVSHVANVMYKKSFCKISDIRW